MGICYINIEKKMITKASKFQYYDMNGSHNQKNGRKEDKKVLKWYP